MHEMLLHMQCKMPHKDCLERHHTHKSIKVPEDKAGASESGQVTHRLVQDLTQTKTNNFASFATGLWYILYVTTVC